MGNYLQMAKRQQVLALLDLGWSFRRIEAETGVRRETISRYHAARAANAAKAFPGSPGADPAPSEGTDDPTAPKAAEVFPGSAANPANVFPGSVPARPRVRISADVDHPFRPMSITHFGDGDQAFRLMSITR